MCVEGLGIAQLSYWDIREEIAAGHLVELHLDDVTAVNVDVWALLLQGSKHQRESMYL